jgi:hypothetical protein
LVFAFRHTTEIGGLAPSRNVAASYALIIQVLQRKEIPMKRTATAVWKGNLREGTGTLGTQSGALDDAPLFFQGPVRG